MSPFDVLKALHDTPLAISQNPRQDILKSPYILSASQFLNELCEVSQISLGDNL